jgi:hypothetical protein
VLGWQTATEFSISLGDPLERDHELGEVWIGGDEASLLAGRGSLGRAWSGEHDRAGPAVIAAHRGEQLKGEDPVLVMEVRTDRDQERSVAEAVSRRRSLTSAAG